MKQIIKSRLYTTKKDHFLLIPDYPIIKQEVLDILKEIGLDISGSMINQEQTFCLSNETRKKLMTHLGIRSYLKIKDVPNWIKEVSKMAKYQIQEEDILKRVIQLENCQQYYFYCQIQQLDEIRPSQYFIQLMAQYVDKSGCLLYFDNDVFLFAFLQHKYNTNKITQINILQCILFDVKKMFPKVESISCLVNILCAKSSKQCLIVCDDYKVDDWKVKLKKWIPENKISKIKHENDTVYATPCVIVIDYTLLKNHLECLNVMKFEMLIIEVNLHSIQKNNYKQIIDLRKQVKSVVVIENIEEFYTIKEFTSFLPLINPSIFTPKRIEKINKRYEMKNLHSVVEQEFLFLMQEYFLSKNPQEILSPQKGFFQRINLELNCRQKKQASLLKRNFNGQDISEFLHQGFHSNEDINLYFSYLNNLKGWLENRLFSYLNNLQRNTLVIAEGDDYLCRVFKKYQKLTFMSSDSNLNEIQIDCYGQILLLQVDQNFAIKTSFLKRFKQASEQKIRIIVIEITDTIESTLLNYMLQ